MHFFLFSVCLATALVTISMASPHPTSPGASSSNSTEVNPPAAKAPNKVRPRPIFDAKLDTVDSRRRRFLQEWAHIVRSKRVTKASVSKGFYVDYQAELKHISAAAWSEDIPLDVVVIGACQGKEDEFIFKYMTQPGWRGVFVEPDENNFKNLVQYFEETMKVAKDRYFLIRAAISNRCDPDGRISYFKPRPTEQQMRSDSFNTSTLPNELGSVIEEIVSGTSKRFKSDGYGSTSVPCMSLSAAISIANQYFLTRPTSNFSSQHLDKSNPEVFSFWPTHVRIDTEGHDFAILKDYFSSLSNVTASPSPSSTCGHHPLFVLWEQDKLLMRDKIELRALMEYFGYRDFSDYHTGFRGRPQDMYGLLNPTSDRYWELCKEVEDRAGIYLYGNSVSRKTGLPIEGI